MSQPYPPDEFDRIPTVTGRRGAHRTRQSPVLAALPVLLVALAVVAVVLVATTLLGSGPPQSAASGTGGDVPVSEPTESTPAPTDTQTSSPTPSPAETSAPSASTPPASTPAVDRTVKIKVLNATRTTGLAGKGAARLKDAGWNVSGTDNYRDGTVPTTVFYASDDMVSTAKAVAGDLGTDRTKLDADLADPITVVLGSDFSG